MIAQGEREDHLYRLKVKLTKVQISALKGKSVWTDDEENLRGMPGPDQEEPVGSSS